MGFFSSAWSVVSSVGGAIASGISTACSVVAGIGGAAIGFARECLPKVGSILATVGGSLGMVANVVVALCQIFSTLRQDEKAEDLGDRALQAAENGIRPENFDHYQDYLERIRSFEINPEKSAQYSPDTKAAAGMQVAISSLEDHFKTPVGALYGLPILVAMSYSGVDEKFFFDKDRLSALLKTTHDINAVVDYLDGRLGRSERATVETTLLKAEQSLMPEKTLADVKGDLREVAAKLEAQMNNVNT